MSDFILGGEETPSEYLQNERERTGKDIAAAYGRIKELEAQVAALAQQPLSVQEGWQTMDTAPKDGTPILARYQWQGKSRFMIIRRHMEHPWWMADHDSYIKHDDSKDTHRNFGFTHWQPLPAPPTVGGEE